MTDKRYDLKMPQLSAAWPIPNSVWRAEQAAAARLPLWAVRPLPVVASSPVNVRRAVYTMAQYFRREFRYDFVQYEEPEGEQDARSRAYLFFPEQTPLGCGCWSPVVGGCCFRRRGEENEPSRFVLQWIWLHPYERRQGHLTRYWPYFQARFGDFEIEHPHSEAMAAFLRKQNAPALAV